MTHLVFDIFSSVTFWREAYSLARAPQEPVDLPTGNCIYRRSDVLAIASSLPYCETLLRDERLHVLGTSENHRRESYNHIVRTWTGPIPPGSFYELKQGVYIASPEFMFLRAASFLDFTRLVAFGDELCGLYSFAPSEKRGFRKRETPLCTKHQLGRYLANTTGCRGFRRATTALAHVVNNSASPMETYDEMTISLPYLRGGYCVFQPKMNRQVDLTDKAARIAKRGKCYLDISWPGHDLDVEHHGKLDHSSEEDRASDRARVNALKEMGIEVIELTYDQIDDLVAYEYIIMRIARTLGKRIDKTKLGPTPARKALREALSSWNASYGKIPESTPRAGA